MTMIDPFIQEFTHEAATTRRLFERIPEDSLPYKPHEKSYSMGELASHMAHSIAWAVMTIDMDVFEMDPEVYKPFIASSKAGLMEEFDKNVSEAIGKMSGCSDESLMANWQMRVGGQVVIEMPRMAVLKSFILNHMIHHRGQLDVYLRLNDVPLPQIYGPTADEPGMMGG